MSDDLTSGGVGFVETPPEGVLRGENVPPENDESAIDQARVEELLGTLKARGRPYVEMSEAELRERARSILDDTDADTNGGA